MKLDVADRLGERVANSPLSAVAEMLRRFFLGRRSCSSVIEAM
jgi:hypothetical protein